MDRRYRSFALDVAAAALRNLGNDLEASKSLPPVAIDVTKLVALLSDLPPFVRAALLTDSRFIYTVLSQNDFYTDVVLPVYDSSPD